MSNAWDEVKRLAADFQKAQHASTLQRLSERNCIEIVNLLIEKQLLNVLFTNDGKAYITPEHLEREIQDELYVNGGRVNLVEVSKALNIDLSRITEVAERLAAGDQQIHFMLGQLIDETYITHIAQEINEKLAQRGEISVSDLTTHYDLPSDFLQHNVMEKHLNKIIRGRQDATNPRVFFTQSYVHRCKAKIRGALIAITRPTNVTTILQHLQIQEKIFHTLFDELAPPGQLTSKQVNAQYVPHIYAKIQTDWINAFYKQNGFLEYDAINKLGISDAKQYIRKQFPQENFMFLKNVALGTHMIELTVVTALNECCVTNQYVDLSTIFPSILSDEDIEEAFNNIMTQHPSMPNSFVYLESIVFSQPYLDDLLKPCYEFAQTQAKNAITNGIYQHYLAEKQLQNKQTGSNTYYEDTSKVDKRDERRKKAASGKTGGGSQGRETKTKSTKKHQRGRNAVAIYDSDDECEQNIHATNKAVKNLILVTHEDVAKIIRKPLDDEGLDHLENPISLLYWEQVNQFAVTKAQEIFETTPQTDRRQTHAAIQEKLNMLLVDIRLYEKGLKLLQGDAQSQLVKYLLKTLGNDICNELTLYIAGECNLTVKSNNLNIDQRIKIAQECGPEYQSALIELNKALTKSIEEFVLATEVVLKICCMINKKIDKKKDRQLILQHKEKLIEQLKVTSDPALVLHLAALILFTIITGCILHASGKFVAQILAHIKPNLNDDQNLLLMNYHDLVLKLLQSDAESKAAKEANEQLQNQKESILDLAMNYEKPGVSKAS